MFVSRSKVLEHPESEHIATDARTIYLTFDPLRILWTIPLEYLKEETVRYRR
jgi:hypothetical protein